MTDATLQIIVKSDMGENLTGEKKARAYRHGDILDVFLSPSIATRSGNTYTLNEPITSLRTGFIHVRDIPQRVGDTPAQAVRRLRRRLCDSGFTDEPNEDPDPEPGDEIMPQMARQRVRRVIIPDLPPARRNQLRDDKETTMLWSSLRPRMRRKQIVDRNDRDADIEIEVTDEELTD